MASNLSADCDLLVIGAGAAGMVAALVGALEGLHVILCEGSQQVGGTTATSAGTLWIPGNHQGVSAGHDDTVSKAAQYLDAVLGPEDPRALRSAFLESGAEAIDYLGQRSQVKFASAGRHPDYLMLPGAAEAGRALSPLLFDGRLLGAGFTRIRAPIPEFMVLGGMMVGKSDIQMLMSRWSSWASMAGSMRLVARYLMDRLRHQRGTRLVMGNALVARLYASLRDVGVDIRFGWTLDELILDEQRVVGASFGGNPQGLRVSSRRGVVLATGGVGHDRALMSELGAADQSAHVLVNESVKGSGIRAGLRAGAAFEQHERGNFFWQPVSTIRHRLGENGGLFPHLFLDRAKPGLIAVDESGRRFANEAASYHHFGEGMLTRERASGAQKFWLICDSAFVRRYGLGVIPPGTRKLEDWVGRGYVVTGRTLIELANRTGIDPAGLASTVARANRDAMKGVDSEFHRGLAPVDRFNGDPAHVPNPCLGEIGEGFYVALRVHVGVAASSAGLVADAYSRVLRSSGEPIDGLYACGNDAASLMRGSYPGPGVTLGPGFVFAYRAARHAAQTHHASHESHRDPIQGRTPIGTDGSNV